MRKKYSIINSLANVINRSVVLITSFIVRFFLARYFLADYLGLNGIFANIIGILSLVDMGLGNAIAFSLYKPIHEKNDTLIVGIMSLYKKVFIVLGLVIFLLSILITPFLQYFVTDTTLNLDYIKIAFIIYSMGVAGTYFFSYNRTLLFAMQRNYIIQVIDTIVNLVSSIVQIVSIVFYSNFLLYLFIQSVFNILSNIFISIITNKKYNSKQVNKVPLSKKYKEYLITQVKALAVTNICGTMITSTDNIIISIVSGVLDLAKNSNYALVITGVRSFVIMTLNGATASIGDLIAEGDKKKIGIYFERYCFLCFICASLCSIMMFYLFDPFIEFWVGKNYLFNQSIKIILVINFYLYIIDYAITVFQNMAGLYTKYRNVSIIAAIINLLVSVILGLRWGILGVFFGTAVTYIYIIIFCSKILHRELLDSNPYSFFKRIIQYSIVGFIIFIICGFATNIYNSKNQILLFLIRAIIIGCIYVVFILVFFWKDENFKFFLNFFKRKGI